ncbi:MAG: tetratricopeptide repeat protein [Putridiphycobacter sp.]|nr:tetratricopeptide repeat protein [Putridiphycobacter sp.]
MAKKQNNTKNKSVDTELTTTENFLDRNKKLFLIIGGVVIALLIVFIGYQKLIKEPKNTESQEVVFAPFYDFENDSIDRAINGTDNYLGMADIAIDYKGTSGGDIANYTMGIMLMEKGEYAEAVEYLENCDFADVMIGNLCIGLIGDCYVELGEFDKAAKFFEKAANREVNEFTTPLFLKKAGLVREELGEKAAANKHYKRIKDEYPRTEQGNDIDRYIGRTNS